MIFNPSLHAVVLIRLSLAGPRALFFIWRNVLIAKHSIEVGPGCTIGPGLNLPHPFGIVIGSGTTIGDNVMLYHSVTLGTRRAPRQGEVLGVPVLGSNVVVHTNAVIAGHVRIGAGSVIGANSFIDSDVGPGEVVRRT
jgi:serine O-acetyltransferase